MEVIGEDRRKYGNGEDMETDTIRREYGDGVNDGDGDYRGDMRDYWRWRDMGMR